MLFFNAILIIEDRISQVVGILSGRGMIEVLFLGGRLSVGIVWS